jgi:hypothetical protein
MWSHRVLPVSLGCCASSRPLSTSVSPAFAFSFGHPIPAFYSTPIWPAHAKHEEPSDASATTFGSRFRVLYVDDPIIVDALDVASVHPLLPCQAYHVRPLVYRHDAPLSPPLTVHFTTFVAKPIATTTASLSSPTLPYLSSIQADASAFREHCRHVNVIIPLL